MELWLARNYRAPPSPASQVLGLKCAPRTAFRINSSTALCLLVSEAGDCQRSTLLLKESGWCTSLKLKDTVTRGWSFQMPHDLSDDCCLSLLRSPPIFASGKKCGPLSLAMQAPKTQGALSYPQLGFLREWYVTGLPRACG